MREYESEIATYTAWLQSERNPEKAVGLLANIERYEESIREINELLDLDTSEPEPPSEPTNVEVSPEAVAFVAEMVKAQERCVDFGATASTYHEAEAEVAKLVEEKLEGLEDFPVFAQDVRVTVTATIDFGGGSAEQR